MASMAAGQVHSNLVYASHLKVSPSELIKPKSSALTSTTTAAAIVPFLSLAQFSSKHGVITACKASSSDSILSPENGEDGISLGTLKLPSNTDIPRFEILLFQWGNSLCQGANLPLPAPLKVDKIPGGARLGFITEDGNTDAMVYIDCLVVPASNGSGPMFRAIRKGPKKDQAPPGEPRVMRSLLDALRKCVEIARI